MAETKNYAQGDFCWVDLSAHDVPAATAFYTKVFDWAFTQYDTQGGPVYGEFNLNGQSVAGLGEMPADMKANGVPQLWSSYVMVDDVQTIVTKAEELGGKITMPPMKVFEEGWLAFFADPTGACIGVWQPLRHKGMTLKNTPGALCWNELNTPDVDKASEFYRTLLGWQFREFTEGNMETKYLLVTANGTDQGGFLQMNEKWEGVPPHWMIYFSVADVADTVKRVSDNGGKVCVPPFDIPVGRMSVVNDPQGGTFSVIQLNQQ